jgi:hypothetical protein
MTDLANPLTAPLEKSSRVPSSDPQASLDPQGIVAKYSQPVSTPVAPPSDPKQ